MTAAADQRALDAALHWLRGVAPHARLVADSRRVRSGDVFVAVPGGRADGRAFIDTALASGAIAVMHEAQGAELRAPGAPALAVDGLTRIAGSLARAHYGAPDASMLTIGVTGTNGKTTCTSWLAHALNRLGQRCATIGTLGAGFPGALDSTGLTTPDIWRLHEAVRDLHAQGAQALAIEVSSIGLDQGRLDGLHFDVVVFTNLTRDHLDYHGTMAEYEAAKARLFDRREARAAVVVLDDAAGPRMAARARGNGIRTMGVTLSDVADASAVEHLIRAYDVRTLRDGTAFAVRLDDGAVFNVELGVLGRYNVINWLACLGALIGAGIDAQAAVDALRDVAPAEGRLQCVQPAQAGAAPLVVVDYAHTPDALENALEALRPVARVRGGRLIAICGCGGNRDKGKRPLMAAAAAKLADVVVLTSDNPRNEDPAAILNDMRAGLPAHAVHRVELDRREAIRSTITQADARDVILLAGKGHERTQDIAGVQHPFYDPDEARDALAAREAHA
ncbi:MAG TPA: UDP-N-acetylmuramoyl-L-alanyl-D-glutamate--2,6-diaminopimelate ligase [Burkholderiaceae bacterium]|nr:UDP-N-acetylmuramoyl-L-alanyl-D-glutamate--2,6-diaminopimelate ligase [Burkholderiaceae bacterium]